MVSFLWVGGWIPPITGIILLTITWISFSSKNLLARPALTGNPALFWSIEIPYVFFSVVGSILCGVNYWYYFVSMRSLIAAWAAMFFILALCAVYFGSKTLSRLSKTGDNFNRRQQLRALCGLVLIVGCSGLSLGVQSYFMTRIDEIYQIYLLCTSLYRVGGSALALGSASYAWVATSHFVAHSIGSRAASELSGKAHPSHSANASSKAGQETSGGDTSEDSEADEKISHPELKDETDSSVSSSSSSNTSDFSSNTSSEGHSEV